MNQSQKFGVRLRELRKQASLTLRELAEKVDVDFTYLSKIENGSLPPPSGKVIIRLAEVLKVDKDELFILAGRIPSDIVQTLNRETLQLLRRRAQAQKKVKVWSQIGGLAMDYRKFARVALAITLVITMGASLWFSSPLPVRALSVGLSTANSPVSGTTTYLLGERITLPAYIRFDPQEFKNFNTVQVNITGPETFTKDLPLVAGTYNYTDVPGNLNVVVTWASGISWGGYGYGYGYGYSTGSGDISYSIRWRPPYTLTAPPTAPPAPLPGKTFRFDISVPQSVQATISANTSWPQGLAYDGTYLYLLLPASYFDGTNYRDVVVKTNTQGTYQSWFVAPGQSGQAEALTFVGSTLYGAYNEWDPTSGNMEGKIKKYVSGSWTTIDPLSNLNPVGGLASDGTSLFIAYRDQLRIEKRNATTGALITNFDLSGAWGSMGAPMWGFNALAYGSDLYAAQGETVIKVDPSTGVKTGEYKTGLWEIRGLDFVSENWGGTAFNILYLATTEWPGKVYRAAKAGDVPTIENTPVGGYSAEFRVVANSTTYTTSSAFTLGKLTTAPVVTVSAPTQNFAYGAGSETINITGSINDPSIAAVTVGIQLPAVTAFGDDVENEAQTTSKWQHSNVAGMMPWGPPYSSSDLWHRSNVRGHTTGGSWSWRYANPATGNYETPGQANAGALRTQSVVAIGTSNTLSFWTWYDGELDFWPDRKRVEVSTNGTTWQLVAWLAKFWPPFTPPDITPQEYSKLVMVPERQWTQVNVSLADFANQSVYIRFRFDTMDDFGNNFEGWYIDDVNVTGAGFLGLSVNVTENLQFSTSFTLAEGANTITVNAARTNYTPTLSGSASVSGSLDTIGPAVNLNPVTTPTNQQYQVISGTVVEANFDRLELRVNTALKWSTTVLGTGGAFSQSILLSEGSNAILITATDKVGLTASRSATINLDTTGPVFEDVFTSRYDVAYKTGELSARPSDFFFIALKITDASSAVASVKLVIPNQTESQWPSAMRKADLPEAVIDSWGIKSSTKTAMNYVMPMQLPSGAPAGDYSWTVRATDTAGNTSQLTVTTRVVTTLEAFNIYLMPDWNLVSSPLIPTNTSIVNLTTAVRATGLLERVWYYDASQAGTVDEWKLYEPGVGGNLTTIEAGKGYWFKMGNLAAFTAAGKVSGPMATGLPNTPAPVKLTIAGQVLQPGAVVPPTYTVYAGWNLVGLHSERATPVSTSLGSVTVPSQKWGSLLQYLNYIYFPEQRQAQPEIDLGRFDRLISTSTMYPGRGFWLYMVQSGTIVP